jgi:4-amino-4-deoxy-L-arabinose transferase-like glycosyltransferase
MPESKNSALIRSISSHPKLSIFVCALVFRLTLILFFPDLIPISPDKINRYDAIALNLIHGKGFAMKNSPTAYAGPLYPGILAALYFFFGQSQLLSRIFLCLLDSIHCALFYSLAKKYFQERVPILTSLVLIFYPFTIYAIFVATSEIPFLFLNTLSIFLLTIALQHKKVRTYFWSGGALGLATLCRAQTLMLPFAVLPAFAFPFGTPLKPRIFRYALFVLAFLLVIGPWIGRNYYVFKKFVPIQTLGGLHFFKSSPFQNRDAEIEAAEEEAQAMKMKSTDKDRYFYRKAWEQIKAHPGIYIKTTSKRILSMWYRTDSARYESLLKLVNGTLLILAIAGVILVRKRWQQFVLLYCIMLYYIFVNMVLGALLRYVFPILPLVTLFAMVPINEALKRMNLSKKTL